MCLTYVSAAIRRFVKDEEAASAIEYALIVAMVAIVVIAFVSPIGSELKTRFQAIQTGLGT